MLPPTRSRACLLYPVLTYERRLTTLILPIAATASTSGTADASFGIVTHLPHWFVAHISRAIYICRIAAAAAKLALALSCSAFSSLNLQAYAFRAKLNAMLNVSPFTQRALPRAARWPGFALLHRHSPCTLPRLRWRSRLSRTSLALSARVLCAFIASRHFSAMRRCLNMPLAKHMLVLAFALNLLLFSMDYALSLGRVV